MRAITGGGCSYSSGGVLGGAWESGIVVWQVRFTGIRVGEASNPGPAAHTVLANSCGGGVRTMPSSAQACGQVSEGGDDNTSATMTTSYEFIN